MKIYFWYILPVLIGFLLWRGNGKSSTMMDWQTHVVETNPAWMHLLPWLLGWLSSCKSEEVIYSSERQTGLPPGAPLFTRFFNINLVWVSNHSDIGLCVTPGPLLYCTDRANALPSVLAIQIVIVSWHSWLEAMPSFWLMYVTAVTLSKGQSTNVLLWSSWKCTMLETLPAIFWWLMWCFCSCTHQFVKQKNCKMKSLHFHPDLLQTGNGMMTKMDLKDAHL